MVPRSVIRKNTHTRSHTWNMEVPGVGQMLLVITLIRTLSSEKIFLYEAVTSRVVRLRT